MYSVKTEKSAKKSLSKIPRSYADKITKIIDQLRNNPFPHGYKKLKRLESEDRYSIRIGPYRIIYKVLENELLILVLKIAHRKDIY